MSGTPYPDLGQGEPPSTRPKNGIGTRSGNPPMDLTLDLAPNLALDQSPPVYRQTENITFAILHMLAVNIRKCKTTLR